MAQLKRANAITALRAESACEGSNPSWAAIAVEKTNNAPPEKHAQKTLIIGNVSVQSADWKNHHGNFRTTHRKT
jgi:hypothetical protein